MKKVPFKIGEKVIGSATLGYSPDGLTMTGEIDVNVLTDGEYNFIFDPGIDGYSIGPINMVTDICDETDGFGDDIPKATLTGLDYLMMPITELSTHHDYTAKAMFSAIAVSSMNTEELEELAEQLLEGK